MGAMKELWAGMIEDKIAWASREMGIPEGEIMQGFEDANRKEPMQVDEYILNLRYKRK